MPIKEEKKLKKQAKKLGLGKKQTGAYVYGTLRKKFGWKPNKEKVKESINFPSFQNFFNESL